MLKTQGLFSYIYRNNLKSFGLVLSYIVVALLLCGAVSCMIAISTVRGTIDAKFAAAWRLFSLEWVHMLLIALAWAGIALVRFQKQINESLNAETLARSQNPDLFNIVENISIACGIPVPRIVIVETLATNAFMTGFTPKHCQLTVTRGLLSSLSTEQLEAVIAHAISQVVTKDTRHLSLATVFSGICFYMAGFIFSSHL